MPTNPATGEALRRLTERLAGEMGGTSAGRPDWAEFEWRVAIAIAAVQGISALLSRSLPWKGVDLWERFLDEQTVQTTLRYEKISELLTDLDRQLTRSGLPTVALKGAALRGYHLYQNTDRATGDVDLLVRPNDLVAVSEVLATVAYAQALNTSRHLVFAPVHESSQVGFGEHVDNPIKIEVHTRIAEKLPIAEVDITTRVMPAQLHPGLNRYPSTAALMLHLLLHAAGNIRARALRMIQLHDVALLSQKMTHDDWLELLNCEPGKRACWWAYPPALLTTRYYPGTIPADVLTTLERRCPWLLRTVSRRHQVADVSWSNIRIPAFPGIEWSRSPWEALRFIKSRVLPRREELALLKYVAANDPASQRTPWYGLSHGARIVRWLVSRPPRVQTMHAVRSAMEYQPPEQ